MTGSIPPSPEKPGPAAGRGGKAARQIALAIELPMVLVGSVVVGGLLGYGLDHWLHSGPIGLLICGALGFVAGVRELLRRLAKETAK